MTTYALTFLNFLLASCAGLAVITVRRQLQALRRMLAERSTRSLTQLDAEVAELSSSFSSLSTTVKRLSSRIGMQDVRERRKEASLPSNFDSLSPAQRKDVLRKKLANGEMRAVRDDGTNHEI